MEDYLIFSTFYEENIDYNSADSLNKMNELLFRQKAIDNVLTGNESAEFLFDILEEQGINSSAYVQEVEENVEFVISNGLILPNTIFNGSICN
jgi:hypothetical protein